MDSKFIVFFFCFSIFFITPGSGLKCYVCNSFTNTSCGHGSDMDKKYLVDCETDDPAFTAVLPDLPENEQWSVCRKITTYVPFDVNTNKYGERIKRTCGWYDLGGDEDESCLRSTGLGGEIVTCTCTADNCNSSTTVGATLALILITLATMGANWRNQ